VSDTPKIPALTGSDPRRWITAIVGGVVLGEALWSLLQLLIRDWAMPALMNAFGQGPTQNQNAFLPQPLFVAFIEACLAGIFLVLLMAWSGRGARRVRVIVDSRATSPALTTTPEGAIGRVGAGYTPTVPSPVPQAARVSAAAATPVVVAAVPQAAMPMDTAPVVSAARVELPVEPVRVPATPQAVVETAEWKVAAESASVPVAAPVPPATQAAPPKPAPVPVKAKSKKPKTVYYNSVGEPIESDD